MERQQSTKRWVSIRLSVFFTAVLCNLYQAVGARFKEILAALALDSDEFEDLRQCLASEVEQQVPGLEPALRTLRLDPETFFAQMTRQLAWASLANMILFTRPQTIEQVARASLKLQAVFRHQVMELLDGNVSEFAHVFPKQPDKAVKPKTASWRKLFVAHAVYSEFEQRVAASKVAEAEHKAAAPLKKPAAPVRTFGPKLEFNPDRAYGLE